MEKIKTLRGFKDIFGEEIEKFKGIEDVARKYLKLLGGEEFAGTELVFGSFSINQSSHKL